MLSASALILFILAVVRISFISKRKYEPWIAMSRITLLCFPPLPSLSAVWSPFPVRTAAVSKYFAILVVCYPDFSAIFFPA